MQPEWQPSELDQAFARSEGLAGDDLRRETERFRDHWTAKAGRYGVKLDWSATFRNWIREARDRKLGNGKKAPVIPGII